MQGIFFWRENLVVVMHVGKTAKLKTKEKGRNQAVAIAVISMNPDSGSNEAVRDYIALLYCASFCGIWL